MKDTFFCLPRFMNLCRKEMVESWRANVLRLVLMYGIMAVAMVWSAYFEYKHTKMSSVDQMWIFLLISFIWGLWIFGCLSASFTMERMKSKTSRTSALMTPATPFEKFFSRWMVFTVVFLVAYLICFKLADYTWVLVFSLIHPEKEFIAPLDLSHLVGDKTGYYTVFKNNLELGVMISGYLFTQSLFVLGSSIWPKNAFLKTFAAIAVVAVVYISVGALFTKIMLQSSKNYSFFGISVSNETVFSLMIVAFMLFALFNWMLAYFRFKESEIINRM